MMYIQEAPFCSNRNYTKLFYLYFNINQLTNEQKQIMLEKLLDNGNNNRFEKMENGFYRFTMSEQFLKLFNSVDTQDIFNTILEHHI